MLYEKMYRDAVPEVCLSTFVMDPIPGMLEGDIRPGGGHLPRRRLQPSFSQRRGESGGVV